MPAPSGGGHAFAAATLASRCFIVVPAALFTCTKATTPAERDAFAPNGSTRGAIGELGRRSGVARSCTQPVCSQNAQSSARAGLHTITQRLGEYGLM